MISFEKSLQFKNLFHGPSLKTQAYRNLKHEIVDELKLDFVSEPGGGAGKVGTR